VYLSNQVAAREKGPTFDRRLPYQGWRIRSSAFGSLLGSATHTLHIAALARHQDPVRVARQLSIATTPGQGELVALARKNQGPAMSDNQ
jgi:hypothetical protein